MAAKLALGYKIGINILCCECAEKFAIDSHYPFLWFSVNESKIVVGHEICSRCKKQFNSSEAKDAAERITAMLEDDSVSF